MKYKWWRYFLAVILFVVAYFLAPLVINILQNLMNLLTPKYYQNTQGWINLVTYLLTPIAVWYVVDRVTPEAFRFEMVLMIIGAFYTVFVTTWNFAFGMLDTITAISMALEAVVFIVMAIYSGKASAESKSVKSNEV